MALANLPDQLDKPVSVLRGPDADYLMNGHHRVVAAYQAGHRTLNAHVMDVRDLAKKGAYYSKFNSHHAPAGSPEGGQFISGDSVGNPAEWAQHIEAGQAKPIHRGPGPVISSDQIEAFTKDSTIKGVSYRGGGHMDGSEGVSIPVYTPNMSQMGRGVYVITEDSKDAKEGAAQYGSVATFALDVRKPLNRFGPEAKAIQASPEFKAMKDHFTGKHDDEGLGTDWKGREAAIVQIIAQKQGYDAVYYNAEDGGKVIAVWDARKVALVKDR
jgi:hypothetical protein